MQTANNPFQDITERLNRIEVVLRDINKVRFHSTSNQDVDIPVSIQEASKITGKSVPTLYGYVHRMLIPHMKRGQRLYFYKQELVNWIESGRVRTVEEIKQAAAQSLEK